MEREGDIDTNSNTKGDEEQMCLINDETIKPRRRRNNKRSVKIESKTFNSECADKPSLNIDTNVPKQSIKDENVGPTKKKRNPRRRSNKCKNVVLTDEKQVELLETNVSNEGNENENFENYLGSLLLNRMSRDIKIDTSEVDESTINPVPPAPEDGNEYPESPECKRRRIEIVSRQCRLHPSNKEFNKGPVVNPPLISPGILVGYTPAGQRHQVDLNFQRPTWFNSEYARRQFDDATKINVSRMLHDLTNGQFLPDTLDPRVEQRYFKEQARVTEEALMHFKNLKLSEKNSSEEKDTETQPSFCFDNNNVSYASFQRAVNVKLLETERHLLELTEFAIVKINDFPNTVCNMIFALLKLELTPLMFLKNPIIFDTINKLTNQKDNMDVSRFACALDYKIKHLFNVPPSQTFEQYFLSEVKRLEEKTKDMSKFDLAIMTEEPGHFPEITNSDESHLNRSQEPENPAVDEAYEEKADQSTEFEDEEWVAVEQGENWQDIDRVDSGYDDSYCEDLKREDAEEHDQEVSADTRDAESQTNPVDAPMAAVHEE